ncbi:MAG: GGDEF domain-containing protein [Desulfurivibrionaceae bacterium]
MTSGFLKLLKNLFVPNGIFFLAIFLGFIYSSLPEVLWPYSRLYPYVLYITAAALCWRFHRDRYIFAIICIGVYERVLYYLVSGNGESIKAEGLSDPGIILLLPINLVILELIKDRGLLTFWGILRWILIAGELSFLGFMYLNPASPLTLTVQNWSAGLTAYPESFAMGLVPVVFLLALIIFALLFLFRQSSSESSSFWALIMLYLGIHHFENPETATYFLSCTSLIFISSILETSYRLAYFDELTGLPGRRALNDQLVRLGNKYTIAMIDIDHFKKFNDRFGHDVGDQVLKMVASKLKGVPGGGRPYRYGGEEFAVIFSGKSLELTKPCLESLRNTVENTDFTLRGLGRSLKKKSPPRKKRRPGKSVRITVSIGVAEKNSMHPDAGSVIKAADQALYRAKKSGRNRVTV